MSREQSPIRERSLVLFEPEEAVIRGQAAHHYARGQNFLVDWVEAKGPSARFDVSSPDESMILLPANGATLTAANEHVTAKTRSVCILPPGTTTVTLPEGGHCIYLSTNRDDLVASEATNESAYAKPDPMVSAIGAHFKRTKGNGRIVVIDIDGIDAPAGQMKSLQSETMSINWIDRDKPRSRTALSPHSHDDFEQGSLAILGTFIHHLRVPWGANADHWRDDEHMDAPPRSLIIIPPGTLHTTEAVGDMHHLLIDVFAPPRRDFIAKGMITNAADYVDTQQG
jgi:mannose-6-phosphate isomerase-like protein (cupin superfamily)